MMDAEEADEFRADFGLGEPATSQVIRASYDTLGLVSFLTVGDDEVRAWSVPGGMPAVNAAGVIHTDFTRGFIRAEVIAYDDFYACGSSIPQGRKGGPVALRGQNLPGPGRRYHQLPRQHLIGLFPWSPSASSAATIPMRFTDCSGRGSGTLWPTTSPPKPRAKPWMAISKGPFPVDLADIASTYLERPQQQFLDSREG